MPFDETAMRAAARDIRAGGNQSVGVASIFSPLDPAHEELAGDILAEECPGAAVTLSHRLGRIGLLERENAALLNAALAGLARDTIAGFRAAIAATGIDAPLYLTQNDGTATSSRPRNSINSRLRWRSPLQPRQTGRLLDLRQTASSLPKTESVASSAYWRKVISFRRDGRRRRRDPGGCSRPRRGSGRRAGRAVV
jgi:hypothetical protein